MTSGNANGEIVSPARKIGGVILEAAKTGGAGWILLALLLTLVSTLLSMRLAD